MKKIILLLSATVLAVACTPKAAKSTAGAEAAAPSVTNAPTETQLAAAEKRFPGVTMDQLKKGHSIYFEGACTRCHGPQPITRWDEKQWSGILDDMAQKAKLSAEEKEATWRYIMGVKLSAK